VRAKHRLVGSRCYLWQPPRVRSIGSGDILLRTLLQFFIFQRDHNPPVTTATPCQCPADSKTMPNSRPASHTDAQIDWVAYVAANPRGHEALLVASTQNFWQSA